MRLRSWIVRLTLPCALVVPAAGCKGDSKPVAPARAIGFREAYVPFEKDKKCDGPVGASLEPVAE
jgi:hypothetical protein